VRGALIKQIMTKIFITILFLFTGLCSQGQDISFEEVNIECLNLNSLNKETIITTNEGYEELLKNKSPFPNCNSDSHPQIDFSKNILVGFIISSGGCSPPKQTSRVYKSENKVVFEVNTSQNGACRMAFQKIVWITIPKEFGKQITFVRTYNQN
jgi:hypothetical protein